MDGFTKLALAVPELEENFDPNFIPENGEQYLQQVIYERKNCPTVVVRPLKKENISEVTDWKNIGVRDEEQDTTELALRPTPEWQKIQISEFSHLRNKIAKIRRDNVHEFTDADLLHFPHIPEEQWMDYCRDNKPLISCMQKINQRTLEELLGHLKDHLFEISEADLSSSEAWLGQWIYACLAWIHLPLEPEHHSVLREIVRACIKFRKSLNVGQEERALSLNLLICIIGNNFNQFDLKD